MTLVLQAHPQLVHLDEVGQDEADRVLQIALGPVAVAGREVVTRLAGQIVAQEQAADGVLDAATHLHHVLHDLLDGRILNGHVDGADGAHEVQAGDDIAGILDELVQVGKVVDGVVLAQVHGEMAQGVEDGHVQLVVLLGAEAAGAELRDERRAVPLHCQHRAISSAAVRSHWGAYLHLSASISLPGVSRQRRMSIVCWRTTASASSSRRAWSSTGGGDAMVSGKAKSPGCGERSRFRHAWLHVVFAAMSTARQAAGMQASRSSCVIITTPCCRSHFVSTRLQNLCCLHCFYIVSTSIYCVYVRSCKTPL
jgi:hypothetical protein